MTGAWLVGAKVETVKRAKELEFKHVLVAHTPAGLVSIQPGERNSTERVEIEQRELYVAMTRAGMGFGSAS
jgi:superfamily I DNA/RNA helicase